MQVGKRIIPQGKPRLKELPNPNRLKIIGGKAKGLRIDSPDVYLRPMMAKVSKFSAFGRYVINVVQRSKKPFSIR